MQRMVRVSLDIATILLPVPLAVLNFGQNNFSYNVCMISHLSVFSRHTLYDFRFLILQ